MRDFLVKAFDDYLVGTANVYTPTHLAELFGSADRLCGMFIVHGVTGASPTLTLQFEHSADSTRWLNQNATPELSAWSLGGTGKFIPFASTRIPTQNFVRLRMALGGTSPSATLEVWICGRSPNR